MATNKKQKTSAPDLSVHTIPADTPVVCLEAAKAFEGLTDKERKYAYWLSKADWEGAKICLIQTSPESAPIFALFQLVFSAQPVANLVAAAKSAAGLTEAQCDAVLLYAASFFGNMGNYKSFGDTKIVPQVPKEKLKQIIWASEAFKRNSVLLEPLWGDCCDQIYSLKSRYRELGLPKKGLSTYYSSDVTEADIALVGEFMQEKQISPYNTRIFKCGEVLKLMLAAGVDTAEDLEHSTGLPDTVHPHLGAHTHKGTSIRVERGDYAPLMKRVVANLGKAKEFAANDHERNMLSHYMHSFMIGSIESHKDGSRHWIKDKGPIIETYIGFIESYRDPYGVRGEFEGFVAMVNKEMSAKFGVLVERAEELTKLLPWPAAYEKDVFLRPDFTSLDVLTFAGSGIPAGINIPNYDDIRQNDGFKNVSLGNVLSAAVPSQKVTFLTASDEELMKKLKGPAFEVQVGLHELLGHGSGKLFQEEKDGKLNFDADAVTHLETGERVTTWYKANETWDGKFSAMSSTYEECRAECVGLHLCLNRDILKIFGHEGAAADDIIYINWLNMVRAGLLALEFYSPETASWKQAHMNARYVILQVLLEAGDGLVKIEQLTGEDGQPDLLMTLDRAKIETTGKEAISKFLMRLQLYKATADFEKGQKMYCGYSAVDNSNAAIPFLHLRSIVLARKQERRFFVQANTKLTGDSVELELYDSSPAGLIDSYVQRFPFHDSELESLWEADKQNHHYEKEHERDDLDLH